VAASDIPVLIMGESGTGKGAGSLAPSQQFAPAKQRLVPLNCAGLSECHLEDELFGHIKGRVHRRGRPSAKGASSTPTEGTLFMDEIGDMPQSMQAKLLRVLENGEGRSPLGSNDPIKGRRPA
jgi:transcriptional regulator with GAF, ATPase, and Fis domain